MGNHLGKKFDQSYLGEERRYRILTYRYGWIQGITINAHKQILDAFQNNAILLFYQLPYIHTCELEFNIFLLH